MRFPKIAPAVCPFLISGLVFTASCATPGGPSQPGQDGGDQSAPVCATPVLGVPEGAFPGLSEEQVLDSLRTAGLLPMERFVGVVRFPGNRNDEFREILFPGLYRKVGVSGNASGPQVDDLGVFEFQKERTWKNITGHEKQGGRGVLVEVFFDPDGTAQATRGRTSSSDTFSSQVEIAAIRVVRQTKFKPALHGGCRIASWMVIGVVFPFDQEDFTW